MPKSFSFVIKFEKQEGGTHNSNAKNLLKADFRASLER